MILPLLREGGPIVSLLLLVLGWLAIWWLLDDIRRLQGITRELAERLLAQQKAHTEQLMAAKQEQVELLLSRPPCPPAP